MHLGPNTANNEYSAFKTKMRPQRKRFERTAPESMKISQ